MPDMRLLEEKNGVTFADCLAACLFTPEFRHEWERLTGNTLVAASPLDRMIDEATGYDMTVMAEFADFVYWYVFCTMEAGEA